MTDGIMLQPSARTNFTTHPARFHLSLNVRDLTKTVAFLRALCGCEPLKCRPDYAKFELDDPPLVLSLEPSPPAPGGSLNHLGFRVASGEDLVEVQRRLELAGIATRRESGVECCYARQTKFWVYDPDGNLWEVYTLDEDLEHRGADSGSLATPACGTPEPPADGAVWKHRLGQPFPSRLPILDASVDYVAAQGTFNEQLDVGLVQERLRELRRILKDNGTLHLHMLTADRPLENRALQLPGPAASVRVAPHDEAFLAALREAGFVDARYVYRATNACFQVDDAELRETRIEARAGA